MDPFFFSEILSVDAKKDPLLFLGSTQSRYYYVIVGLVMTYICLNPRFATLGVLNTFIRHITFLSTFFYREQPIVNLFPIFRAFTNIFQNILTPLSRTYLGSMRNIVQRISMGRFQHPPYFPHTSGGKPSSPSLKSFIQLEDT